MKITTILFATLFATLLGIPVTASAQVLLTEADFYQDLPVVLTASRMAQTPLEAPAAVTIIDRDMIRSSGARDVAQIFRLAPGFQVGRLRGHLPTVTYRGLSDQFSRRMQVLVDGRSVYEPIIGGVFWNDIPLAVEDIERVEVIRGSNTAAYGSNAFLAIINIITRHASQDHRPFVKLSTGSNDISDRFFRIGGAVGAAQFRLSGGYRQDNGYKILPDDLKAPYASLRADWRLSNITTVELQSGIAAGTRGNGEYGSPSEVPHDTKITSHFQQLHWRRSYDVNNEWSAQIYHIGRNNDETYVTEPIDLGFAQPVRIPVDLTYREQRTDFELQQNLSSGRHWRFMWGLGARLDETKAPTLFSTQHKLMVKQYRLFAHTEWRPGSKWTVNLGGMLEKTNDTDMEFSPRLAVSYAFIPQHAIRISASKALRNPVLFEQSAEQKFYYQDTLVEYLNTSFKNLKPEKLLSYEIGILSQPSPVWQWDFRVYYERFHDFINEVVTPVEELNPQNHAFAYINDGELRLTGAELQLRLRPTARNQLHFSIANNRASMDTLTSALTHINSEDQTADSMPNWTANLLYMSNFYRAWDACVALYGVDETRWLGEGNRVPRYIRTDLRLARQLHSGSFDGSIALVIQNLGSDYATIRNDQLLSRRYYISMQWRL